MAFLKFLTVGAALAAISQGIAISGRDVLSVNSTNLSNKRQSGSVTIYVAADCDDSQGSATFSLPADGSDGDCDAMQPAAEGIPPLSCMSVRLTGIPGACTADLEFYADNGSPICTNDGFAVANNVGDGCRSGQGSFDAVAVALVGACSI